KDDLASDANDKVASQQSIKKYVDDQDAFGAWDTGKSENTEYTAATDGIVTAMANATDTTLHLYGETPTGTQRVKEIHTAGDNTTSICYPVKKGDTWKVIRTGGGAAIVQWLPRGT
ncbi:unnamed protein product, partial [marine sediment metagenome]